MRISIICGFPSQRDSDVENVTMSEFYHVQADETMLLGCVEWQNPSPYLSEALAPSQSP